MLVAYEALRPSISGVPSGAWQRWKQFFWTLPFFAVVGAYVAVRTLLFGVNTGPGPGGSRWAALLDIPLVLILYLHNLFWPFRLSFFYPVEWGSEWTVLKAAAIVLAMVTAIYLWIQYQDRSGVRLQLLWAAILFVPPVLGVYAFERAAWGQDRQVYLVSVPICLIVAALLTDRRLPTKASILVSALVLAILLVDTVFQVPRFSDNAAIYASALKVAPRNTLAHGYYAEALWSYGRYEQGLREFKIVTDLLPKSPGAYERYGAALAQTGQDDEAMAEYAKALHWSTSPTALRAVVLSEMTGIELKRSEFQEAADHAREAIQIAPQTLNYHSLLAQALSRQGHTREADEEMRIEAGIRQRYVQEQRASKN
jgi:tetratricopeptide (TPR) repeat protein